MVFFLAVVVFLVAVFLAVDFLAAVCGFFPADDFADVLDARLAIDLVAFLGGFCANKPNACSIVTVSASIPLVNLALVVPCLTYGP